MAGILALLLSAGCATTPAAKEAKYLNRGQKYFEKKDFSRAIIDYKNAARQVPTDPEPYYRLGVACLEIGDAQGAVGYFRKATELNPNHTASKLKLAEMMVNSPDRSVVEESEKLSRAAAAAPKENADAVATLALAQLRLGRGADAEQLLRESLAKSPQNFRAAAVLATARMAQQDSAGAEQVLKQAADSSPKSAEAPLALSRLYQVMKRPADAEAQLQRALSIEPNNAQALLDLAGLQMASKRTEQAGQTFQKLANLPNSPHKDIHAIFLMETGKMNEGIVELEKLVKANSEDRALRTRLISAYLAANRTADADKLLSDVLKNNSRDVEALLQRSQVSLRAAKYGDAEKDLQTAMGIQPESAEAHYYLSKVYAAQGNQFNQRRELNEALNRKADFLEARLELAQLLTNSGDPRTALDVLSKVPEAQSSLAPVVAQRNWAYLAQGDAAQLQASFAKVPAANRTPEMNLQAALLELKQKKPMVARPLLEDVLKQNPQETRALDALAATYLVSNDKAGAIQKVQQYADEHRPLFAVQQFAGAWMLAAGEREKAKNAFNAAKAASPGSPTPILGLAQVELSAGNSAEAKKLLTSLTEKPGAPASAFMLLAASEEQAGNFQGAVTQFRRVLDMEPDNILVLNNLAYHLANDLKQPDEALKYAQRAQELAPNNSSVQDSLGWVYYQKGLYGKAVQSLESSVKQEQTPLRMYHLGMAYQKNGNQKKGEELVASAVRLDPKLGSAVVADKGH